MPTHKPHFVPGDLQFLTSNTYRRSKLLESDRLLAAELRSAPAGDWINELTMTLIQVLAVHTQSQAETARRLAVETWLQRNGVITITQNKKVLPVFLAQSAHN